MDFQLPVTVQQELAKLGVATIYLFGSRAEGTAHDLSDYDFALVMRYDQPVPREQLFSDLYQQAYNILSPLCPRTNPNDSIDIIFFERVPLELQSHIIRKGKVIMDHDPVARLNFESIVMLRFADFEPYRLTMRNALLARI
jgi:predicted nucleotidyltransferase